MLWQEIRNYIEDRGFMQTVVARNAGMTKMALSSSLKGERKISADEYLRICKALDVSPDYFGKEQEVEV